jgi:thioredoxin-like negative regulator of GroEL
LFSFSYAPWCPACKQFTPVWAEFSNVIASKNVKVAAVDVEKHPALSGRFRISALPTVY